MTQNTPKERKVIAKLEPTKPKRTDAELATAHKAKVEHYIRSVEKWTAKLGKAMSSRKYPMSVAQKQYALEYLDKVQDKFVGTISGTVEAKPDFKLPE